jgi:cysteine-rich repeat protein
MTDTAAGEACDTCGVETAACEVNCKAARCGDGILNTLAGEECDDGNNVSGDGCDDKCRNEICGDRIIEDDEQCDDGVNALSGLCPACRTAICGDFHVRTTPPQTKEQCDEGPTPNPHGACPVGCRNASCGDSLVWNTEGGNEQCDDGVNSTNGACPSCRTAFCGDFHVWNTNGGTEQCDEGTSPSPNGACPTMCKHATCGDGLVWNIEGGTEQCDRGTGVNNDNDVCTTHCLNARCGDGLLYTGHEDCDSGGVDTSMCNGGNCHTPMCGDNYVNMAAGEQCDEGLTPDPAGACPAGCTNAYCGDGYVWTLELGMEQCDHGAGVNGNDGICDASCQCVAGPPCQ